MASETESTSGSGRDEVAAGATAAEQGPPRWKVIGPGLVVAATGVGAADMVATLVAGSRYGYGLLWAVVLGVVLKIVLVEGAGRFTLAPPGHRRRSGPVGLGRPGDLTTGSAPPPW